ncbi:MAG: M48 family metalloprotease [Paludibacteraceae bacterium]|nr:M48 family metalloprotease [Paludibacteraceae bacterium]
MSTPDFIHPEDAAALKALQAIPALSSVVKAFMNLGVEQMQTGLNLATKVKLSPQQLPKLYHILPPICKTLDIKEPDFFLEMSPIPNAYAFGDTQTAITITSGLVDLMTEDELRAVVAHECGHIACHHMLYHTIAVILANASGMFEVMTKLAAPIKYALFYWQRKSELSCDRVAAYITNPQITASMLARLAGGSKHVTVELDLAEMAGQADLYDALCNSGLWNKTLQTYAVLEMTHPFTSVRIREMLLWIDSDEYKGLKGKTKRCPHCGKTVDNSWQFCQHCGNKL